MSDSEVITEYSTTYMGLDRIRDCTMTDCILRRRLANINREINRRNRFDRLDSTNIAAHHILLTMLMNWMPNSYRPTAMLATTAERWRPYPDFVFSILFDDSRKNLHSLVRLTILPLQKFRKTASPETIFSLVFRINWAKVPNLIVRKLINTLCF